MLLLCVKQCFLLQVRSTGGEWQTVEVPSSVKAIVVLNLQSYAGGRDLWGLKDTAKDAQKGWRTPIFNDGTIEVGVMLAAFCRTARGGPICHEQQVVLRKSGWLCVAHRTVSEPPAGSMPWTLLCSRPCLGCRPEGCCFLQLTGRELQ